MLIAVPRAELERPRDGQPQRPQKSRRGRMMTAETSSLEGQLESLKRVYMSRAQLAKHFNVTERAISKIIKRKKWRKMKHMGSQAIYSLLAADLTDEGDGRRKYGQVSRATRDNDTSAADDANE